MQWLTDHLIDPLMTVMYGYVLLVLLVGAGIYFTVRSRALQVRLFPAMVRLVTRAGGDAAGGISSFQAFAVGLASRVGTGNIAGVAIALTIGGPGSIFWMWCVAALSMATAFIEATLAQIYKVPGPGSTFVGGPAYYIQRGLGSRRWGVVFAVLLIFAFGFAFNMVQANAIGDAFSTTHGVSTWIVALVLVVLAAPVLFGGTKRIATISGWSLPVIAGAYLLLAAVVVVLNLDALPDALSLIVRSAFGLDQAVAGVTGGLVASLVNGVKRGLFSNEGGMGSAPNAAATATVNHPAKQGLVQSLGVFVDTMVVCSATAFLILVSGVYDPTAGGVAGGALTTTAAAATLGQWVVPVMTGMIFLFAFTSVLGNYSYAEVNLRFLGLHARGLTVVRLLVLAAVGLGAMVDLEVAWSVADIAMGFMALVNLVAIIRLAPWALGALADYSERRRTGREEEWFYGRGNAFLPGDVPGDVWPPHPGTVAAALDVDPVERAPVHSRSRCPRPSRPSSPRRLPSIGANVPDTRLERGDAGRVRRTPVYYYSSSSGLVRQFALRLERPVFDLSVPEHRRSQADGPWVLLTPSYKSGNARNDTIPEAVKRFLRSPENRRRLVGVIGSGNRNFGRYYQRAAREIAELSGRPVLFEFELSGTPWDVTECRRILTDLDVALAATPAATSESPLEATPSASLEGSLEGSCGETRATAAAQMR